MDKGQVCFCIQKANNKEYPDNGGHGGKKCNAYITPPDAAGPKVLCRKSVHRGTHEDKAGNIKHVQQIRLVLDTEKQEQIVKHHYEQDTVKNSVHKKSILVVPDKPIRGPQNTVYFC